jgi:hydroxyacylglutathione hydrolase
MFRRFFDEGLAQTSYLLACERTRRAAIVDPRRDIDEYVAFAGRHQLAITHAIETHTHADFVSGARELAEIGATVIAGPGAALGYPHDEVQDGTVLSIGDVTLTCLHTPGHTPEHISLLAAAPGAPARLFTGDTLFVGAVGRPDLLGDAAARALAGDLYDSLFQKLLVLPDSVQVHPGHGAGSLCGAGIQDEPHSTIGRERAFSPLLQHRAKQAFVTAVLGDLPETPPYFSRMKRLNREGPFVLALSHGVEPPPAVTARVAAEAVASGAWLLDLRSAAAFGAGHAAGALCMSYGPKLGHWAGWIVPADARVLLMLDGTVRHAADARRQLLRVGVDRVDGFVEGGFDAWNAESLPVRQTSQIPVAALRDGSRPENLTIVDVRSPREWESGHLPGALHIPLGELVDRAGAIPRGGVVATVCEGGYRSSLAASLLERHGIANVANIVGGMHEWRQSGTDLRLRIEDGGMVID